MGCNRADAKSEAAYQRVKAVIEKARIAGETGKPLSQEARDYSYVFQELHKSNPVFEAYCSGVMKRKLKDAWHRQITLTSDNPNRNPKAPMERTSRLAP